MASPEELVTSTPQEGAHRVALSLLAEGRAAARRLDDPDDAEALHDFRVAVRRLRSACRSWRGEFGQGAIKRRHRRALSDLQAATGGGRDAEVALEWLETQRDTLGPEHIPGLEWLAARLERRRAACQSALDAHLRASFEDLADGLEKRLVHVRIKRDLRVGRELSFADVLAEQAEASADKLCRRLARISEADQQREQHEARILCKRLRYLLEPVRRCAEPVRAVVQRCKQLQDLIGDLHDTHVLASDLDSALDASSGERAERVRSLAQQGFAERARREAWFTEWPGLLELIERLDRRGRELFDALREEWLETDAAALRTEVGAAAAALRALAHPDEEIERKFLLARLPSLADLPVERLEIEQGWLPGKRLRERIRRVVRPDATRCSRAVKLGRGVRRLELEEACDDATFAALWPLTCRARLRKRRYRVREGELLWEVDEFLDRALVLAEVELPDEDTKLELPAWLRPHVVREVTGAPGFSGSELALDTRSQAARSGDPAGAEARSSVTPAEALPSAAARGGLGR